ncbi:MAG: heme o synthase [Planctomycetota bacterium]
MTTAVETALGARGRFNALVELCKIRLSALAVAAVAAGLALARPGAIELGLLASCVAGTMLVAFAGSAFNMLIEREHDRRMDRTRHRPLPSGRLSPGFVFGFGAVCAALGLGLLWWQTNPLATALCAAILGTYVLVYTPLKRATELNTLVGAIPGALPPLVGYAAAGGGLDVRALVLFLVVFLWQIPHFLAIAWRYREDYRRGGMLMLPVTDPGGAATGRQMVVYTVALVAVSLAAPSVGLGGPVYMTVAACAGVLFLVPVVVAAMTRAESAMRLCFLASITYLPIVLGVMVLDGPWA